METVAVKKVFGDEHSRTIPISSIKSMIGHSIAASGAIEAVALAMSLSESVVPPTINLTHPDPNCDSTACRSPLATTTTSWRSRRASASVVRTAR